MAKRKVRLTVGQTTYFYTEGKPMSKKVFNLVTAIVGGVSSIASALVAYFEPAYTPAIVGGIGIASTAILEICSLFVKTEAK